MFDIYGSAELQAVVLAMRDMDRSLRKTIFKATREKIVPAWRQELAANSSSFLEDRILVAGARADATATGIRFKAGQSVKRLSGGASPKDIAHAVEFGADARVATIDANSSAGKAYTYKRRINTQFKARNKRGYLVFPTGHKLAPRAAALWTQITVKLMSDAFDGKSH